MCVCVHVCTCVCACTCMCVCVSTYACVLMNTAYNKNMPYIGKFLFEIFLFEFLCLNFSRV